MLVKEITHGIDGFGTFDESIFHLFVDNQIDIPHPVALLRIGKGIIEHAIFFFYDGQWPERFAQHFHVGYVNRDFSHLGHKHKTTHANDIANVEHSLKNIVVQTFVFSRAQIIAFEIQLNTSGTILQFNKGCGPHDTPTHDAACNTYILEGFFVVVKLFSNYFGVGSYIKLFRRIGIDPCLV